MARIQLRDTTIYIQDGLSGTGQVDIGNSALGVPAVTETTAGVTGTTDEVQTLAQYVRAPSGGDYTITLYDGVNPAVTTAAIAFDATAATIETAIDVAMTAATYPSWTNGDISVGESGAAGISDGTVTLTYDGTSVQQKPWENAILNGAALTGATGSVGLNIGLQSLVLNSNNTDLVPVGARFTIAGETGLPVHTVTNRDNDDHSDSATLRIAFTPTLASVVSESDAITWLPQRIQIAIGDGDLSWTENRELIYDLDRDQLDTVRLGEDQPLEVELAFTFVYVTTESGQEITPVDALKRIGEATEWVSSSSDLCEPYAVDIYAIHCVPCGTDQDQDFLFADFRYESLEYSIQDASIAVSGRCNVTDVTSTRADITGC